MPVAERLASAGFRVLVPDLRGFGASPDPDAPYSFVDDLIELLDRLKTDRLLVAGWSFGGEVAGNLAHSHPERVAALALVNSMVSGYPPAPETLAYREREDALREEEDVAGMIENDLAMWVAGSGRSLERVDPAVVEHVRSELTDLARRDAELGFSFNEDFEMSSEQVAALPMPLLAIHSEHDHDDVRGSARELAAAGDDARELGIEGCAHAGPLERPDAYAEVLAGFFAEIG